MGLQRVMEPKFIRNEVGGATESDGAKGCRVGGEIIGYCDYLFVLLFVCTTH